MHSNQTAVNDRNAHGFTLIEMMITVAIVAILAAIAYPSYQQQVRKTRRADCEGVIMEMANALERYYTENNSYVGFTLGAGNNFSNQCPKDTGTAATYNLSLPTLTANSFVIQAAPTGAQNGDMCGNLTLNQAMQKGVGSSTVSQCW